MITRKAVIGALGLATATFPQYPATKEMIDSYTLLLGDLEGTEEELIEATKTVLRSQPYFPTVFAIRQELVAVLHKLAPSNGQVWKEIMERREFRNSQVRKLHMIPTGTHEFDKYKASESWIYAFSPHWSHPAIKETIDTLGGWSEVYRILEVNNQISTFRSQLWKIYEDFAAPMNKLTYLGQSKYQGELE